MYDKFIYAEKLKQNLLAKGFYPALVNAALRDMPAENVIKVPESTTELLNTKNKLKKLLSEIKYPVFEGMKPEVSLKVQFSDEAFDYIIDEMIKRGVVLQDGQDSKD